MFVRLAVSAELVKQESEVVKVIPAVPFMFSLFVMINRGGELNNSPVRIVGAGGSKDSV
jgi:hypothetical protein